MGFCEYLDRGRCTLLEERCFRLREWKRCDFATHYERLLVKPTDPPLTIRLKEMLRPRVVERWKKYAREGAPSGMKRMTGGPLEEVVIELIKSELSGLDVEILMRKKITLLEKVINIMPDCIIRKSEKPQSFISIKTWIGPGASIRDILAKGFLVKRAFGEINVKMYAVALMPYALPNINRIIDVYRPYIDGIYFISEPPYIDELIAELKRTYS